MIYPSHFLIFSLHFEFLARDRGRGVSEASASLMQICVMGSVKQKRPRQPTLVSKEGERVPDASYYHSLDPSTVFPVFPFFRWHRLPFNEVGGIIKSHVSPVAQRLS
jgi:hypothetical protein